MMNYYNLFENNAYYCIKLSSASQSVFLNLQISSEKKCIKKKNTAITISFSKQYGTKWWWINEIAEWIEWKKIVTKVKEANYCLLCWSLWRFRWWIKGMWTQNDYNMSCVKICGKISPWIELDFFFKDERDRIWE